MAIDINRWHYSREHNQPCQVIESQTLWGEIFCRVWLPQSDSVVRVAASRLEPLEGARAISPEYIAYVTAAARVADALTQDVLLAPMETSVIPLPHQIRALSRAIQNDRVRYLLADEVGLGKTIEAGLILRELKLRGLVKRTLVIAPKGLVSQWVSEMRFHFSEEFHLIFPGDIKSLTRIARVLGPDSSGESGGGGPANVWQMFPQVVVPMDSVKPVERRRGWAIEELAEYNRERYEDLISAGWDLVIIDEAHRLGGSTDQVARFKLGQGLAGAAPYLLLLTATPHQGKTDAFHRLISLLDEQEFPDISTIKRERVEPYVIRTEKRRAIDAEGRPLFKPRHTQLATVSWEEHHRDQEHLYEAVTEYVRDGYNQAIREKRSYIGFLMILMQRLVVSSTRAIRTTLEKRLEALAVPEEQLMLFPLGSEEEWADLDGQEQVDTLLRFRLKALKNERAEVKLLLQAASHCERMGPDAKAEALLDWLYCLQSEEGETALKVLIFTEFVPTQGMLREFLTERGFSVVCLNGSMSMEERKRVQESFAGDTRILVSTDAGGEGLNLQFCHVVINYDIPWNPMRLEQRIGRVDRIGQTRAVRAVNFVFEGSVEHRVREVLERKLAIIFEEYGIDKTGDVLDSAQAGNMFDEMYVKAILDPGRIEDSVEDVVRRLRDQAQEARSSASVLGATVDLDPSEAQKLLTHPLPHWVERMTVNYLTSHNGRAVKQGQTWELTWPDGQICPNAVFSVKEAERLAAVTHFTIEDSKVRELAMRLPRFVPGQPISTVAVPGISNEAHGLWALWQITLSAVDWSQRRIVPLFLADSGRVFALTAKHVWDQLLASNPVMRGILDSDASKTAFEQFQKVAEEHVKFAYDSLMQEHRTFIARERQKAEYAFSARRSTIHRIGLPQVRDYRLNALLQEERMFREQMERRSQVFPEMIPVCVLRLEGSA